MLGTIKKSLSNLSKLSSGVYMDEEPKSEASGTKSGSKSEPKMDSAPAIPASVSLVEIEKNMDVSELEDTEQFNGGPPTDKKGKRGRGRPKKSLSTNAMAEPKSKPKMESDSAPAIPASISFIEMENTMGPIKFEETKDSTGDPPTAIKGKRGRGRPKKSNSTKAVKKEDKQVNGDASDSPADDKAAEKTAEAGPSEGKDEKPAKKKKPVKKTIPAWASIDDDKKKKAASAAAPTSGALAVIEEAIVVCANNKGHASAAALRSYVKKEYPQWPKMTYKAAMKRAIAQHRIVLVRGTGLAGTFKKGKNFKKKPDQPAKKGKDTKNKKGSSGSKPLVPLEDLFPNAFCWIAHPKESSFNYMKKYIGKHYKDLDVEGKAFRNAVEGALKKGQLKRVTGAGMSGTFSLVDGAQKTGGKYEDAIEDAIIANNAPKDASVAKLRDYLGEYYKEYETDMKPMRLLKALERAEAAGHIERISGTGGFSGSFKLSYPYYPSPKELWGKWYEDPNKAASPTKKRGKKAAESSDEESSSEEEESEDESSSDEEDDEPVYVPRNKKRGPPTARKPPPAKRQKKPLATPKRQKQPAPAKAKGKGRGRPRK